MKTTLLLRAAAALLALGALLSGCAEMDKLWKIDGMTPAEFLEDDKRRRAEGRPTLRQEKENQASRGQSASGGASGQGQHVCRTVQARGKANVDTAYIRAMQAFPFKTNEEDRRLMPDSDVKHNKTPGVMYDLSDAVAMTGPTAPYYAVDIDLRLSKSGAGSALTSKYCLSPADSGSSDSIAEKLKALVR